MSEEFVEYAGRSEPKERWLKALPLIIAGVLGVPLLCAAIMFSWQIAQTTKYLFDLGTSGWEAAGMVLLSLSGAFCVVFWISRSSSSAPAVARGSGASGGVSPPFLPPELCRCGGSSAASSPTSDLRRRAGLG
jgi:hypothetical protein